jgi:hypothetical protein
VSAMVEITEFRPNELPVPSKVDLIKRGGDSLVELITDAYFAETGTIEKQQAWMQRCTAMTPELANIAIEFESGSRQASRPDIASAIKIVKANFHNSGKNVTADTIKILADAIGSEQPSILVLKLAVKKMIADHEFFVVTKNALDAIHASVAFVHRVNGAMGSLQHWHERVSKALAESEVDERKSEQERKRRNASMEAVKAACREIIGTDDPEAIRSLITSTDEPLKDRVRARRDELLSAPPTAAPPPASPAGSPP